MTELTVDARGRRCPLPIIELAAAARSALPGTLITLLADDPAAAADVSAWCRMRGQDYEGSAPADVPAPGTGAGGPVMAYRVRIRAA